VQLTYHSDYALRLLIYMINRPEQKVTTREVATFYGISLNHLIKVAKALTKAGWLSTSRGLGGGLRLAPHTPAASIGEIVRHTQNWALVECFDLQTNTCPIAGACGLKPILHQAQRAFFQVLDGYKVSDLGKMPAMPGALVGKASR
jgi:Rrf2 family transcriptional regulator, nitric oxide-sensitive transcriptional repressor